MKRVRGFGWHRFPIFLWVVMFLPICNGQEQGLKTNGDHGQIIGLESRYDLTHSSEILWDPSSQWGPLDLLRPELAEGFRKNARGRLPIADFRGSAWLRIHLDWSSGAPDKWVLFLPLPQIDLVEVYRFKENTPVFHGASGRQVAFETKTLPFRIPAIPLDRKDSGTEVLFVKLVGAKEIQPSLQLMTLPEFTVLASRDYYTAGLFFGVIVCIICLYLFLWVMASQHMYLYFVLFLCSMALSVFFSLGFAYELLPLKVPPLWADLGTRIFFSLTLFWILWFSRAFLQLGRREPGWDRFCQWLGVATLSWIPLLFLRQSMLSDLQDAFGMITSLLLVYVGLRFRRTGLKSDLYFAFSLLVLACGYLIDAYFYLVLEKVIGVGIYAVVILFQVTLLALAMADLIKSNAKEKDKAQAEAMVYLRENLALKSNYNQKLETEIAERIEEIKAKNARLKSQAEKLRSHDSIKSRFFANVSHELRTPLALVRGPLDDLISGRDGPLSQEAIDHLELSLRSVGKLEDLTGQFLTLAKLETEKLHLRARALSMVAFLRRQLGAFSSHAQRLGLSITFHSQPEDVKLYFDEAQMEMVTNNLLSNAFKFTPSGGTVSVLVRDQTCRQTDRGVGRFVTIEFRDTGLGIQAEHLPHIFDRFYQGPATSAAAGSGIGLALVKELVELHGGVIEVESVPDRGTCFTLLFPKGRDHLGDHEIEDREETPVGLELATQREGDQTPEQPLDSEALSEERQPVLVVEDNHEMRNYLVGHLQKHYAVFQAADGLAGLQLAKQHHPVLVISDVMMPKMDGLELVENLKKCEQTASIPVILLSARAEDEDRMAGLALRADEYLSKPFNIEELNLRVKNLIASRSQLRKRYAQKMLSPEGDTLDLNSADEAFLKKARRRVSSHLADDAFDVAKLAELLYVSEQTLRRRLAGLTQKTPAAFIREIRLDHARRLLKQRTVTSVREAAYKVGFKSAGYFSRLFARHFGCNAQDLLRDREGPS